MRVGRYFVLLFRSQPAELGLPLLDALAQTEGSVTGFPVASLQAPDEQTDTSVTGLPLASVQVFVDKRAGVVDVSPPATGWPARVAEALADSSRPAANVARSKDAYFMVFPG
jgi:hypothetical protein